jgi:hypothetical protein
MTAGQRIRLPQWPRCLRPQEHWNFKFKSRSRHGCKAALFCVVIGVDGSMILEWILGKQGVKLWTGFIWLRIGTSGGLP